MEMFANETVMLTILMPCLNEEKTICECIKDAQTYLNDSQITGEILIADNGSTDRSAELARRCGARVISVPEKGYGNALIAGMQHAKGKYIIFGDCDRTYDFTLLHPFYRAFEQGADMVIGNRMNRTMEQGAMKVHHRVGAEVLSWIGRTCYHVKVRDFHCGLRGVTRKTALQMDLHTPGMEFATEFIAEAARLKLEIAEIQISLHRSTKGRKSHLRAVPDGIRHIRYMLKNH